MSFLSQLSSLETRTANNTQVSPSVSVPLRYCHDVQQENHQGIIISLVSKLSFNQWLFNSSPHSSNFCNYCFASVNTAKLTSVYYLLVPWFPKHPEYLIIPSVNIFLSSDSFQFKMFWKLFLNYIFSPFFPHTWQIRGLPVRRLEVLQIHVFLLPPSPQPRVRMLVDVEARQLYSHSQLLATQTFSTVAMLRFLWLTPAAGGRRPSRTSPLLYMKGTA